MSAITKVINIGTLLLAFSRPIQLFLTAAGRGTQETLDEIGFEASMGMTRGSFDKDAAIRFYGPMLGAIILKKAVSMVRRTARV